MTERIQTVHPFLSELRSGLRRCLPQQSRLLVAVSGGADSVALLRGLVELRSEFSLELIVAHLNHGLRGADSDSDANWVEDLARSLSLPSEIGQLSPHSLSSQERGLEEQARKLRHQFLEQSAMKTGCPEIALAHTADDQSETVLHHLFRGTGLAGLRGIPAVRMTSSGCRLIRPLLAVRRHQVEDYLRSCGQSFCTDQTNWDTAITRNKLRHVILPLLREQLNPQIDAALSRLSEQAGEIDEILQAEVERLLALCLKDQQLDTCRLDVSGMTGQPLHLIRELFRRVWQIQNWPQQAMGFEQWNRLAEILVTRKAVTLPHQIEARFHSENLLVIRRLGNPGPRREAKSPSAIGG